MRRKKTSKPDFIAHDHDLQFAISNNYGAHLIVSARLEQGIIVHSFLDYMIYLRTISMPLRAFFFAVD